MGQDPTLAMQKVGNPVANPRRLVDHLVGELLQGWSMLLGGFVLAGLVALLV
jgi:hypothetical protein